MATGTARTASTVGTICARARAAHAQTGVTADDAASPAWWAAPPWCAICSNPAWSLIALIRIIAPGRQQQ